MVDDLDNSRQTAGVRAVTLEEDDAADLHEAPVGSDDACLAHCVGDLLVKRLIRIED